MIVLCAGAQSHFGAKNHCYFLMVFVNKFINKYKNYTMIYIIKEVKIDIMNEKFQFLIYNSADEKFSINSVFKDESIWLTQKSMAELFDVDVPAISKHLSNIYSEGELQKDATISKMEIVQNVK